MQTSYSRATIVVCIPSMDIFSGQCCTGTYMYSFVKQQFTVRTRYCSDDKNSVHERHTATTQHSSQAAMPRPLTTSAGRFWRCRMGMVQLRRDALLLSKTLSSANVFCCFYVVKWAPTFVRNQERPYHVDHATSRPLCEVKRRRARLVLRWGTTWEALVLFLFRH